MAKRDTRPIFCACGCRRIDHHLVIQRRTGKEWGRCAECDCVEFNAVPRPGRLVDRVITWMSGKDAMTRKEVATALEEDYFAINSAFERMLKTGSITNIGSGRFRLTTKP